VFNLRRFFAAVVLIILPSCSDQSLAQAPDADARVPDAAHPDAALPDAALPDAAVQPTELAGQLEHPRGLFVDGNEIYFTTNGTRLFDSIDGQVQRISRTGGTSEMLATGLHGPDVIRVDATHAYWMSMGGSDQTMDPAAIQGVAKQGARAMLSRERERENQPIKAMRTRIRRRSSMTSWLVLQLASASQSARVIGSSSGSSAVPFGAQGTHLSTSSAALAGSPSPIFPSRNSLGIISPQSPESLTIGNRASARIAGVRQADCARS
jgi:hypothetical protein